MSCSSEVEVLIMKSGPPEDFDFIEIETFIKSNLVIWGGPMTQRLDRCVRFVTLRKINNGTMVGFSAIKTPFLSYRRKIFTRSMTTQRVADFEYELGYTAVTKDYRRRGLSGRMVGETLSNFRCSVFATVDSTNAPMLSVLRKNDFTIDSTYVSKLNPSKQMHLCVRKEVEEYGQQIFSGWFPISQS